MNCWEDGLIADDQCLPVKWLTRSKNLYRHRLKRNTGNPVYWRRAKSLPSLTIRCVFQRKKWNDMAKKPDLSSAKRLKPTARPYGQAVGVPRAYLAMEPQVTIRSPRPSAQSEEHRSSSTAVSRPQALFLSPPYRPRRCHEMVHDSSDL